jgi:hypothetical protein
MRNKKAEFTRRVAIMMPPDLYDRLFRQAARESLDRREIVTPSHVIRWAVEDYLNTYETATFVRPGDATFVEPGELPPAGGQGEPAAPEPGAEPNAAEFETADEAAAADREQVS